VPEQLAELGLALDSLHLRALLLLPARLELSAQLLDGGRQRPLIDRVVARVADEAAGVVAELVLQLGHAVGLLLERHDLPARNTYLSRRTSQL
jgi:hypothetical protein